MRKRGDVTDALLALRNGESDAWDRVFDQLYDELKQVARGQLRRLRPGQTLGTTDLVHETYLKFVDQTRVELNDREHFYAVAARAMRQILVDYARRLGRAKRGAGQTKVQLDEEPLICDPLNFEQILAVSGALDKLAKHSARQARIVEYRYFIGLTEKEIADLLSVSSRTIRNEWARARVWLLEAMRIENESAEPDR